MGGGQSIPIKLSSVRQEAPFPTIDPIGIGKGMAEGCQAPGGGICQLAIAAGVSASGAKLYREMGSITREKCKKYGDDADKVRANKMAFEEFRKGLLDGIYYRDLGNEYCGQVLYDASDLAKVSKIEELDATKARMPIIRKVSASGGFSSVTKAFIKPSIPFEIEFNSKPHKINVLTLMHPSPIRVENIQHDAMLTLGDPGEGNNDGLVVLVPLVGSLTAGASGAFIGKITRFMSGILNPNPATGQYESIDVPTGSDWKLSSIFPGAPGEGGKTYVKSPGYYVWSGQPPLDLKLTRTDVNRDRIFGIWERGNTDNYAWSETGNPGIRYVMLSQPVQVSSMDLQTIMMLPSTPITEAISPIVKSTLSYRTAGSVGPDGRFVTECPARLPSMTNFFGGTRESFEDSCDPFAPGNFPSNAPTTETLVKIVSGLLGALGVFLAIYVAVKLWTQPGWGRWFADKGEMVGNFFPQVTITDPRKRTPPTGAYKTSEDEAKMAEAAEARLSAPAIRPVTDEEKAERRKKPKPAAEVKAEDTDTEKAIEASKKDAEAKAKQDAKDAADDAAEEAGWEAADRERERKRAADEAVLRRNGPAGTGLDFTDEQLAQNADVERARVEAEAEAKRKAEAEMKRQADATNALFAEAKARKEAEEKKAADAVEAEIKKEKEKLEAEEARIKAESEAAAASASDVASKTLKRRNVQPSDRDLAKLEAERKRQADELAQKDKEAARASKPSAEGRESAGVPTPKGERPPSLPVVSQTKVTATGETRKEEDPTNALGDYETAVKAYEDSTPATRDAALARVRGLEPRVRGITKNSTTLKPRYETLLQRAERATAAFKRQGESASSPALVLSDAERVKGQINATLASIGKQEVFINANPPTKDHPNRIFNQRLETRLNTSLKTLDSQLTELEALVKKFPADKGLERMGMERFIKQTQEKEKKSLTAQNQRFDVLGKIIKEGPAMKGGRRKRMKRKSTRRYVA
jgi:hypothetical protein